MNRDLEILKHSLRELYDHEDEYIDDFGNKEKEVLSAMQELARERAIGFHRWAYENQYSKYWGSDGPNCDKWYKGYTMPDRTYYSDSELYDLYLSQLK